jgi:hypothetical protein
MSIFIGVDEMEKTTDPLSANPTDTTIRKQTEKAIRAVEGGKQRCFIN